MDSGSFDFHNNHKRIMSTKVIVGVVTGALTLVGVIGLVAAMVIYTRRGKKNYEKLPLLADE